MPPRITENRVFITEQETLALRIVELRPTEIPMDLLLLADPSEVAIRKYLNESRCFVAYVDDVVVGTGTYGYQLGFYQRQGFRVDRIDKDFFLKHYPEPIVEDGIQHKDMLRLTLEFHRVLPGCGHDTGKEPS